MIERDTRTATWWRAVEPPPAAEPRAPAAPARRRERRRRAGLRQDPSAPRGATAAAPGAELLAERPRDLIGIAWGVLWWYGVVGSVALEVIAGPRIPAAALLAIGAGGVIVGFWFRRGWAPALWRACVLGWLAAATAGSLLFPGVLAAALLVVTVEPWLSARHRPAARVEPSRRR
jgi:hypothetical protein